MGLEGLLIPSAAIKSGRQSHPLSSLLLRLPRHSVLSLAWSPRRLSESFWVVPSGSWDSTLPPVQTHRASPLDVPLSLAGLVQKAHWSESEWLHLSPELASSPRPSPAAFLCPPTCNPSHPHTPGQVSLCCGGLLGTPAARRYSPFPPDDPSISSFTLHHRPPSPTATVTLERQALIPPPLPHLNCFLPEALPPAPSCSVLIFSHKPSPSLL